MSNPPDRYETVPLTHDPIADLDAINKLADEGFRFVAILPYESGAGRPVVLMGNYGS